MPVGKGEPGRVLPVLKRVFTTGRRYRGAFSHTADRTGAPASLWLPAGYSRVETSRDASEPQAGVPTDRSSSVGWKLDRTLTFRLAVDALQPAIELRHPLAGLVHHSDRGVQYASAEYVAILKQHGVVPSMSQPANPYDNASCESFFKTLKGRKSMPTSTRIWSTCMITSRSSSNGTTIRSACIPPWVTVRPRSSNLKPG